MDYETIERYRLEKITCMARLKIIDLSPELYELYERYISASYIGNKIRCQELKKKYMLQELKEYSLKNNVRFYEL